MKIPYEINVSGGASINGEVELRPCPFCGEKDELELVNTHTAICWVECKNCGAEATGRHFANGKGNSTRAHFLLAIESGKDAWNRRIR